MPPSITFLIQLQNTIKKFRFTGNFLLTEKIKNPKGDLTHFHKTSRRMFSMVIYIRH
jgi:hypothetical protein